MSDPIEGSRDDFYSEAQELIEALSRTLLGLDSSGRGGSIDPDQINEAFRAVHTLKSLAGLFSSLTIRDLSHHLEEVLDAVRLGRLHVDAELLNVLFACVDVYWQALAAEQGDADPPALGEILEKLRARGAGAPQQEQLGDYAVEPELLAVLTEFEEHRLRTCVAEGLNLYRIRVQFDLMSIDKDIEALKAKAKPFGEVITYLPTGSPTSPERIELDLLLASDSTEGEIHAGLGEGLEVVEIPRVGRDPAVSPPPDSLVPSVSPAALAQQDPAQLLRSVSRTVRVDINKLDSLMNVIGELSLSKGALSDLAEELRNEGHRQLSQQLHRVRRDLERRLRELQTGILEVRMVPLNQIFERLARVVRQLGFDSTKEVRLVITGGETELDKLIVEELSDPLLHVVRNSIDHGVESPKERKRLGKSATGTIALNAFQKGSHVVIEIEDDGAGIDVDALVARAVERKLLDATEAPTLPGRDRLALIFLPGLSTRDQADEISGRGVGMDVVKTNIAQLGGIIDIESEPGIGTKVTMTLPITLSIVSSLLLRVAGHMFALPLSGVMEALAFTDGSSRTIDGREYMSLRGSSLQLCRLERFFGYPQPARPPKRRFVVVASLGARRLGLVVDHLVGQRDIVIKPLGESLRAVSGFAGATELGDQRVALVIDAPAIIEEVSGAEVRVEAPRLGHG